MTWSELEEVISVIPHLRVVEMGYNQIGHLSPFPSSVPSNLQVVNLDGNELHDWARICERFKFHSTYVPNLHAWCRYEYFAQRGASYLDFKSN